MTPLWNTIRSFWTPETNRNPEWLREVRRDKAAFLVVVLAVAGACTGFIVAGANMVGMLER